MNKQNIGTRETLLANKPKLTEFEFEGKIYFVRDLTVGDINREIFEFRQWLIERAEEQGIELDFSNDEILDKQLEQIGDQYRLARNIANKLCNEDGQNLFDPTNVEDLKLISNLNDRLLSAFNQAIGYNAKNLPPDASSS